MNTPTRRTPAPEQPPRPRDGGAASAEMVIATPLLMLIILLAVQFGIWAHATHIAQATAAEALAAARVRGGTDAAGRQRAQQVLTQIGSPVLASPDIAISRTAAAVTVHITGTAERVLPLPGVALPVAVTVTGPIERLTPVGAP
jgi:Flp pilus assembly protein TadG